MAEDGITTDDLRAMFGAAIPLEAYEVLHPPLQARQRTFRPVAEIRAALVAVALAHRDAPLRMSPDVEAELYAMAKLLNCGSGRAPVDREMADEQFLHTLRTPRLLEYRLSEAREKLGLLRDFRVEMVRYLAGRRDPDDLSATGVALEERSREEVVQLVSDMLDGACDAEVEIDDARDAMGATLLTLTEGRLREPVTVRVSFTGNDDGAFNVEWAGGSVLVQRERHLRILQRRLEEHVQPLLLPGPGPR